MGSFDLKYFDSVKYLGVLLDSKLMFGLHIRDKGRKAIRLLYHFRASIRQLWGPSPFLGRWVLMGIVHPKVMDSAIMWAHKFTKNKKHLERVQRLGLLTMTHVWQSTFPAGLDTILDEMLLDLFAQCTAAQLVLRVQGRNQCS